MQTLMHKFRIPYTNHQIVEFNKFLYAIELTESGEIPFDISRLGVSVRFWRVEDALVFSLKFGITESPEIADSNFDDGFKTIIDRARWNVWKSTAPTNKV